jgi:hypothetical protein
MAESHDASDKSAFMAEYSVWLRAKGYPGMADRLAQRWKITAPTQGERPLEVRKAG